MSNHNHHIVPIYKCIELGLSNKDNLRLMVLQSDLFQRITWYD